jgi:hypothetical protein
MKKYALYGFAVGIIILILAASVVIFKEWREYNGKCMSMGFPFLAESQQYDCTFTQYIKNDYRSIFWLWPYDPRLWASIISMLVIPVLVGIIIGVRKK